MTTNAEVLLALRAPGADWLATLITALAESHQDPEFTTQLRRVFADVAAMDTIPDALVAASHRRTSEFTASLVAAADAVPEPVERPRLTLVVG